MSKIKLDLRGYSLLEIVKNYPEEVAEAIEKHYEERKHYLKELTRYDFESDENLNSLPEMVPVPLGDYVKFKDVEKYFYED